MINKFIEFCKDNNKTAILYREKNKFLKVDFKSFYLDCLKMKNLLESQITNQEKVLVFAYPCAYSFYVAMFAGFMSGMNLVVIDSFKDKKLTETMIGTADVRYVLVDNLTKHLLFKLPKLSVINIASFRTNQASTKDVKNGSVTTFTSGTTGNPKAITRNLDYLFSQAKLIEDNMDINDFDLVYGGLPMYSILSIYLGYTTSISKKINSIRHINPTVVISSIKNVLSIKKEVLSVKKCFIGGAILYKEEATKIAKIFPNASIIYVYGATESALIYKTTVKDYLENPFSFQSCIQGIQVSIANPNNEGIGEIVISGDIVLSAEEKHYTADIGKLENGVLSVLGRTKYSSLDLRYYNYVIDSGLRESNPRLKIGFSMVLNNKVYIFYNGKIDNKIPGYIYYKCKKIPFDLKHKTKFNYEKVKKLLKNNIYT